MSCLRLTDRDSGEAKRGETLRTAQITFYAPSVIIISFEAQTSQFGPWGGTKSGVTLGPLPTVYVVRRLNL